MKIVIKNVHITVSQVNEIRKSICVSRFSDLLEVLLSTCEIVLLESCDPRLIGRTVNGVGDNDCSFPRTRIQPFNSPSLYLVSFFISSQIFFYLLEELIFHSTGLLLQLQRIENKKILKDLFVFLVGNCCGLNDTR